MLHICRSSYSFLRGYGSPEQFVARAKLTGGTVIAADYCSTWGHVAWEQAGVHALGITLPAVATLEKDPRHGLVTLVANDSAGLRNLYTVVSLGFEQFYHRPRVTWEQVAGLEGITAYLDTALSAETDLALAACQGGYLVKPRFQTLDLDVPDKLIAACDARYPEVSDRAVYELVGKMTRTIGEIEGNPTHVLYPSEWKRLMMQSGPIPANLVEPATHDATIHHASLLAINGDLRALCEQQPRFNLVRESDTYGIRYELELKLIADKGFDSYFLFVADLVQWAKQRMLVGPGRGSAGGSLVCYILSITEVDPIKHGTLFERFIDPGRSDFPDIDVDFPDHKREQVFAYLEAKYGKDRVARVGTLSDFGGKMVFNDIARVYSIPFQETRRLTACLDGFSGGTAHLATARFALGAADDDLIERYPEFKYALALDGFPRHTGVHASGVIVTQEPVQSFGAVKEGVVALDLKAAEALGLMKMDALGLKTLSVLEHTLDAAGVPWSDLLALGYNDPDVWDLLNADRVAGIFQFEGPSVRGLLKRVKVTQFSDLSALTSLARPGPLMAGAADDWIARKLGAAWRSLIPQLDETYGLIVYQEQAMAIVREIAGFDVVDVNGFRRAIGKKDPAKLASYKERFMEKAVPWFAAHHGLSHLSDLESEANSLWHDMEEFGSYAFNLAHAVAYSMLSYWTAWAKAKHPLEYACAYLNYADEDHCRAFIREYGATKLTLFDDKVAQEGWSIVGGRICGGFLNIKGIGPSLAGRFVKLRNADPVAWKDKLTAAQAKLLSGETVYDDLAFFEINYKAVYDYPDNYKLTRRPQLIDDIPTEKGTYLFLGRMTKIIERADKSGLKYALVFFSDDSGELPCTVSKYDYADKYATADEGRNYFKVGQAYAVYAWLPKGERRWAFIDSVRRLHDVARKDHSERGVLDEAQDPWGKREEIGADAQRPSGDGTGPGEGVQK